MKDTADSGDNSKRLSALLIVNVKHLKPIEDAFQSLLTVVLSGEKCGELSEHVTPLAEKFLSYVEYAASMETLTVSFRCYV